MHNRLEGLFHKLASWGDVRSTKGLMFGAGDDLVLQRPAQITEVVAIAGHAHDEVAVLLRVGLGRPQRGCVDHVELDVVAVEPEVVRISCTSLSRSSSFLSRWGVSFWLSSVPPVRR